MTSGVAEGAQVAVAQGNPMLSPRIEKVVVNISVGNNWERLQRAMKLLEQLTGQKPSIRRAKKTIKTFGISKGDPVACIVTLRKQRAYEFLRKALKAVGNKLPISCVDEHGNFAFGIKEHLDIPGTKYDPSIGIFGMDVVVHLARPGLRVQLRKRRRSKVGKKHRLTKEDAIKYVEEKFWVEWVG